MNVFQKINEVKKCVQSFSKDSSTSGKGAYKYTSGSQVLGAIKETMENIGLLFLPVRTELRGWNTFEYTNSYGDQKTDFIVDGKIHYRWINIDDPNDCLDVEFDIYGQQNDISKAFGSALTYTERYALLKSLGVPTDEEDPDRVTDVKKSRQTNIKTPARETPTSNGYVPPQPQNPPPAFAQAVPPQNPPRRSKYAIATDLAYTAGVSDQRLRDWVQEKFGAGVRINDLDDAQFKVLCQTLEMKIKQVKGGTSDVV